MIKYVYNYQLTVSPGLAYTELAAMEDMIEEGTGPGRVACMSCGESRDKLRGRVYLDTSGI